jgi:hypothetical protein
MLAAILTGEIMLEHANGLLGMWAALSLQNPRVSARKMGRKKTRIGELQEFQELLRDDEIPY